MADCVYANSSLINDYVTGIGLDSGFSQLASGTDKWTTIRLDFLYWALAILDNLVFPCRPKTATALSHLYNSLMTSLLITPNDVRTNKEGNSNMT